MRSRSLFPILLLAAPLWLGANCTVVEETSYEDRPYSGESAEEQTADEQMEQVEEQINR